MKKLVSLTLAALLAANLGVTAFASEEVTETEYGQVSVIFARDYTYAEETAVKLKSLGLFRGVSDTDFDLDRAPTRTEAVVMLIRFLGKEAEALDGKCTHPFTDVPEWADAYVGYAYENKLTNGISATEFGANNDASSAMFLTFVLRALGYSDADGADFAWDNPYDLAKETGILTDTVNTEQFYRADVAIVAYNALEAELKGTETSLSDKLIEGGVFTAEAYAAVAPAPIAPEEPAKKYNYRTDFTDYSPSDGLTEDGLFEGVNIADLVDFTEYDKFDMTQYNTVTDAELNKSVAETFSDYDFKRITDRAVVDGDVIDMTVEVYVDGELVSSDKADFCDIDKSVISDMYGTVEYILPEYLAGADISFIFDLAEELFDGIIGLKPGESAEFSVGDSFDKLIELMRIAGEDVSEAEEFVGKDIVIKFTVDSIYDLNIIPELTDEMVAAWGYDTVEEFLADEREYLLEEKQGVGMMALLASVKTNEIPDEIMEYFINMNLFALYALAEEAGMSLEEVASALYGGEAASMDELVNDVLIPGLETSIKTVVLMLAIAEREGITVTDEDLTSEEYAEIIEASGDSGTPFIKLNIRIIKATEYFMGIFE